MSDACGSARSQNAVVVSSHRLATEAALATLRDGGSLADAAIAAGAVLTVVSQPATSLAGDAIILVHDAKPGITRCLNATGRAPQATDVSLFRDGMPWRGAKTVTSPGLVAGWQALHRSDGRLPWAHLFARARDLAHGGFAVSNKLAAEVKHYASTLREDAGAAALFLRQNEPIPAGEKLVQPQLSRCLDQIMSRGAEGFYKGRIPEQLSATVQRLGGFLTPADFDACEACWVDPIALDYRSHTVAVPPPNSYGLALLMQLTALGSEPFPKVGLDSSDRFKRLIVAAQVAFTACEPFVADPALAQPVAEALAESFRRKVEMDYRNRTGQMPPMPTGGTATVSLMDREGSAVIVLQSVMQEFGSGIVDPDTGILLNNRMSGFTHLPGRANTVAPGKKPAHTLTPSLVKKGGAVRYVIGTPGGSGQTATLAQAINGLLDLGHSASDVIAAPRWSLGRAGRLLVEAGMPPATVEQLQGAGLAVEQIFEHVPYFGSLEVIERHDDALIGTVDHRREAFAGAL